LLNNILAKVFGTSNERAVKRLLPAVAQINALEPAIQALSDEQLRAKTDEFRQRIAASVAAENIDPAEEDAAERTRAAEKAALEEVLPEAFAVVRVPCRCATSMFSSSAAWSSTRARSPR
jgi:preprotein translocase subunit SecA